MENADRTSIAFGGEAVGLRGMIAWRSEILIRSAHPAGGLRLGRSADPPDALAYGSIGTVTLEAAAPTTETPIRSRTTGGLRKGGSTSLASSASTRPSG
ncbi:hypothetical protein BSZ37_19535 [Rubrivirga marina]|uniref:Uncharacterized protein n=1 Tax=Rubrivirga marina TaxID=1196024 RepID=A0A271J4K8_9BACT|nr:hypothetical protein BSZ37_19535 [Rubrivirga marina]